jgi:GMP synthase (glutamine-hydrolysing)
LASWRTSPEEVLSWRPKGFILSGGPNSVYDDNAPSIPPYILNSNLPILGICYGMQLLVYQYGGRVVRGHLREYGPAHLAIDDPENPLFFGWKTHEEGDLEGKFQDDLAQIWMSHSDLVTELPSGFRALAHTSNSPYAAVQDPSRGYYAVQFHPEVAHTRQGSLLIRNFAQLICGCAPDWTPSNYIDEQVNQLKEKIGKDKVIVGLSGGVDSAVTAGLLHRAVGDQLTAVFVDHGLMRKGEVNQVVETFKERLGAQFGAVCAAEEFLEALSGVGDPEIKRKVIGEMFIHIFEREAVRMGDIKYLAQGTIYPDVIESATRDKSEAATIKTHHNVGGLPEFFDFQLVEPLRLLFKDEVRLIGKELGLPEAIVSRQPFPGPGLAIRCLGPVTWERLEKLRAADAIFIEELSKANMLQNRTQQAFAVLLPVKSVGVMGDGRTYEEVVALRAVTTEDFMTADWARLPDRLLSVVSSRIVNEVPGVNRVVYDITSKPPATIEWE